MNPRLHHLVPAFYLSGFTDSGLPNGKLFTFDYPRGRNYATTPRKAGRERDFFRHFECEGDQFEMEKEFATLEGTYAEALGELLHHGRITSREQVYTVMRLASLIQCKTKRTRMMLEMRLQHSMRNALARGQVSEEQWNGLRDERIRAGLNESLMPTLREATRLVLSGDWQPPVPRPLLVGLLGDVQEVFYKALSRRSWELHLTVPNDTGDLITSDSPLCWGALPRVGDRWLADNINDPNVEVTFPISKAMAMVSYPEARSANHIATREIIAHINARTVFMSTGSLYFSHDHFWIEQSGGRVETSHDYFTYVKFSRLQGIEQP